MPYDTSGFLPDSAFYFGEWPKASKALNAQGKWALQEPHIAIAQQQRLYYLGFADDSSIYRYTPTGQLVGQLGAGVQNTTTVTAAELLPHQRNMPAQGVSFWHNYLLKPIYSSLTVLNDAVIVREVLLPLQPETIERFLQLHKQTWKNYRSSACHTDESYTKRYMNMYILNSLRPRLLQFYSVDGALLNTLSFPHDVQVFTGTLHELVYGHYDHAGGEYRLVRQNLNR
jgi:hypothetical protein